MIGMRKERRDLGIISDRRSQVKAKGLLLPSTSRLTAYY